MRLATCVETEPFPRRLKSYLFWMIPVSAVFFGVYPTLNLFTASRDDTLALWIPAELNIPFIPGFIWVYFSLYLIILLPVFFLNQREQQRFAVELMAITLVAAFVFLLLPARLGFEREGPSDPFYRALYNSLFALDYPHNLVPSLHVAWSCTAVLAMTRKSVGWFAGLLYGWLAAIALSTLFIHQHHLLDVITGGLLSCVVYHLTGRVYEKPCDPAAGTG